jgi:hypothetical protein|tara:strand:+ start:765 stop:1082 length:318 start_codon:yes stop_codon:yes gene_type:complete
MDIHLCIDHLKLNLNSYRLDQSNPPHEIIGWDGPDPQPTFSELSTAWAEIGATHDSQEYARKRQAEYPSINDLIVALWENVVEERAASVIELEAKRQAIKTKYPK